MYRCAFIRLAFICNIGCRRWRARLILGWHRSYSKIQVYGDVKTISPLAQILIQIAKINNQLILFNIAFLKLVGAKANYMVDIIRCGTRMANQTKILAMGYMLKRYLSTYIPKDNRRLHNDIPRRMNSQITHNLNFST